MIKCKKKELYWLSKSDIAEMIIDSIGDKNFTINIVGDTLVIDFITKIT